MNNEPRMLTLEVPTPESLGLSPHLDCGFDRRLGDRGIAITESAGTANLYIESSRSGYYGSGTTVHVDVDLPSLDHALVALGLILGTVA